MFGIQRQGGSSAGRVDTYYLSPQGKRFRSKVSVERFLNGEEVLEKPRGSKAVEKEATRTKKKEEPKATKTKPTKKSQKVEEARPKTIPPNNKVSPTTTKMRAVQQIPKSTVSKPTTPETDQGERAKQNKRPREEAEQKGTSVPKLVLRLDENLDDDDMPSGAEGTKKRKLSPTSDAQVSPKPTTPIATRTMSHVPKGTGQDQPASQSQSLRKVQQSTRPASTTPTTNSNPPSLRQTTKSKTPSQEGQKGSPPSANTAKTTSLKNIAKSQTNSKQPTTTTPPKPSINIRTKAKSTALVEAPIEKEVKPATQKKETPEELELRLLALFDAPMKSTKAEREARAKAEEEEKLRKEAERKREAEREEERKLMEKVEQELEIDFSGMGTETVYYEPTDESVYYEPEPILRSPTRNQTSPKAKSVTFGPSEIQEYKPTISRVEIGPTPDSSLNVEERNLRTNATTQNGISPLCVPFNLF